MLKERQSELRVEKGTVNFDWEQEGLGSGKPPQKKLFDVDLGR